MKNIHILPTEDKGRITKYNKELHIEKIAIYNEPSIKMEVFNIYITNNEEIKEGDWHLKPKYSSAIKIGYEINQADSSYFGGYGYDWTYCKKIILTTDLDLIKDGVQAIDDEFLEWFIKNPSCENIKIESTYKDFNPITYTHKIIIPKEEAKQYPIGGYAPGFYSCKCVNCKIEFTGDKRAVQCEPCAIKMTQEEPKQKVICTNDICQGECVECNFMTIVNVEEPKQETLEEASHTAWLNYEHVEGNLYSTSFKNGFKFGAKWQQERMYSEEEVIFFIKEALNYSSLHYNRVSVDDWFEQYKKK